MILLFPTYELSLCLRYLRLYLRTLLAPWEEEEEIGNALEEEEQKQQQHVVAISIYPPQLPSTTVCWCCWRADFYAAIAFDSIVVFLRQRVIVVVVVDGQRFYQFGRIWDSGASVE